MSLFPISPVLAAKAYKLSKRGLKGKAIAEKLGKGITTDEANLLAAVGRHVDKLVKKLGEKALKSKGKRATAFYGALVVQVKEIMP